MYLAAQIDMADLDFRCQNVILLTPLGERLIGGQLGRIRFDAIAIGCRKPATHGAGADGTPARCAALHWKQNEVLRKLSCIDDTHFSLIQPDTA